MTTQIKGLARVRSKTQQRYAEVREYLAYCRAISKNSERLAFGANPAGFEEELTRLKAEGAWIETLKDEIATLRKKEPKSYTALHFATTVDAAQKAIAAGVDVNKPSLLGKTALVIAYENEREEVMQVLYEHGADVDAIGWTALHVAAHWGTAKDVQAALPDRHILRPDHLGKTTLDIAITRGDADILGVLLPNIPAGAAAPVLDRALMDAAVFGTADVVRTLLGFGASIEAENEWDETALAAAARWGNAEIVAVLLDAGASVESVKIFQAPEKYPQQGYDDVTALLLAAGWTPDMLDEDSRRDVRHFTGAALIPKQTIDPAYFIKKCAARFGQKNPERANEPAWLEMIRNGQGAWFAREKLGGGKKTGTLLFCFDRFGQSTTRLPDGRWVQIGGEHEDSYDPDFCIYNDVVVHDGAGGCDIYLYPKDVFPPTDFHTATLIGDRILIVGCLGYSNARVVGHTPVYWLNLGDFSITCAQTSGDAPGWIFNHRATFNDHKVTISGGDVFTKDDGRPLAGIYTLDLKTMNWTRTA